MNKIMEKYKNNSSEYLAEIQKILIEEYGFQIAAEAGIPMDKDGNPLPLYTYPAIEYLATFDFSGKNIFEFGSGQSTLYWLRQNANVVSVENNQKWIEKLKEDLKEFTDHQHILANQKDDYINSILQFPDHHFDLIIIDGVPSRYLCAKNVLSKIKKNGLVILDNSDWYPNTAQFLKENLNFIQVDFYGLRPSRPNAATTSMFFSRNFDWKIKSNRQPNYARGGKIKHSALDGE
jgi:predicted O-methyltransferase YrrM